MIPSSLSILFISIVDNAIGLGRIGALEANTPSFGASNGGSI